MTYQQTTLHIVNRMLRQVGQHEARAAEEDTIILLAQLGLTAAVIAARIRDNRVDA